MLMQQVAQSSHSIEQARQASMQFLEFFILFVFKFVNTKRGIEIIEILQMSIIAHLQNSRE